MTLEQQIEALIEPLEKKSYDLALNNPNNFHFGMTLEQRELDAKISIAKEILKMLHTEQNIMGLAIEQKMEDAMVRAKFKERENNISLKYYYEGMAKAYKDIWMGVKEEVHKQCRFA